MGGPTRRVRSHVDGRARRARPPAAPGVVRGAYVLSAFFLIVSLFLPMASLTTLAAPTSGNDRLASGNLEQRPGTPPPLPAPNRVVVAGDFQDEIGCPEDWDKTCNASELQSDGSGVWSATIPVPPGNYNFRVVTSSDIDRSLGEGGDPDGNDLSLEVPDGAIGVYFAYNQYTGAIVAEPLFNQYELATDVGNFPMAPTSDGNFEAYVDAQPDSQFNAQVLIDGAPATDPVQIDAGPEGRAHVVADQNGNITEAEPVSPATLTVEKFDENGNPLPGACFAVYDGNDVVGQACDADDGEDGITTINFPNGAEGRGLELAETFTPDGQSAAEDQDISIDPGENSVQVVVTGGGQPTDEPTDEPTDQPTDEPTDEPTEEPTDEVPAGVEVTLVAVDENGNPLPGACYELDNGDSACDDDGDGTVTFTLEPGATYTVTETQEPEGYAGLGQAQFTAPDSDQSFQIDHTAVEQPAQTGSLILYKVDQDGNPLAGSCYNIRPRAGTEGDEVNVCDADDGSDDGVINAAELAEGRWRVEETTVPEGYEGRRPFNVEIVAGQPTEETVENTQAAAETGTLVAYTADQDGNPVGGVCYTVVGTQSDLGEQCDEDGDGDMGLTDIPADTYTVRQSSVPDGYTLDENEQTVEVPAGGDARVDFVSPAAAPETGNLTILKQDENGNPLGGACFIVTNDQGQQSDQFCDDEGDGEITFNNVEPGTYTVDETVAPEGYQADQGQTAEVVGGETATVTFVNQPAAAESGALIVNVTDPEGFSIVGACVSVQGPETAEVCDNGDGDSDPEEGIIRVEELEPGDYEVQATGVPEGFEEPAPTQASVEAGQDATASLVSGEIPTPEPTEEPTGSLLVRKVDANGDLIDGACFQLDGPQTYGPICDNAEGDIEDAGGRIRIENILAGDYTVTETTVPAGYTGSDPQTVTVDAGDTSRVTFENQLSAGSITVTTADENGTAIGGTCYSLDGGDQQCDDDGDGVVSFGDVAPGDHTVSQTSAPEGYGASDPSDQTINVQAGTESPLTFTVALLPGAIQINKTDESGNPLGGACFSVDGGDPVCDDGASDDSGDEGVILISGVAPGDHTVSETQAPEGYQAGDDQQVSVAAGETAQVTFANSQQPGSIRITKTDEQGNPLAGACFSVNAGQEVCDNGDGDGDDADGVVLIDGVPAGVQTVAETVAPAGYNVGDEQQVEVPGGGTGELTFVNSAQAGSVRIIKTDENGGPLGGACFSIDGGDPVCDNGEGDADGNDGAIQVDDVPAGSHSVSETQAPDGYQAGDDQQVDVPAGQTGEVTFTNTRQPGSIRITKTDAEGNSLSGACFAVNGGDPVCDNGDGDADGNDGAIQIDDLAEGDATVEETQAPEGYVAAEAQTVSVQAGAVAEVTFANSPSSGIVQITTADEFSSDPLSGACFELAGATTIQACDNGDGDADDAEGSIRIENVPAGDYTLTETQFPDGYGSIEPSTPITVTGGQSVELTVANRPNPTATPTEEPTEEATPTEEPTEEPTTEATATPTEEPTEEATVEATASPTEEPEPEVGSVQINKTDDQGNALAGACFALTGASDIGPICDNDASDGNADDGVIAIADVIVGDYTLSETTAPEGYSIAADQELTVQAGETAEVTVVNTAEPQTTGDLRIVSVDADGNPVGGGCYQIGSSEVCDNDPNDADPAPGVVLVENVVTGDVEVTETQAPDGFQTAAPQTVTIPADAAAEVTFSHEPAPVETGGLRLELRDPDGNPVPGACVTLSDESNANGTVYCDGGPEDQEPAESILVIEGLPVGSYSISQSEPPGSESAARASFDGVGSTGATAPSLFDLAAVPDQPRTWSGSLHAAPIPNEKTVTVQANIIIIVIIIIIIEVPQDGDLQIVKRASDTNQLQPGACFRINGPSGESELCDNDGFDANGTVGVIRFTDLAFGDYTVEETVAPAGYEPADDRTVTIDDGGVTSILIRNDPVTDTTGSLTIHKIDENGDPLPGACFELRSGANVIAGPVCDDTDGDDDGDITFVDIEKGTYTLRETQAPSDDYEPVPDQPVTVVAGNDDTSIDVVNTLKPGSILITKTAEDGSTLLEGACFGFDRGDGIEFEVCDQQPSDGDGEVGIIEFEEVPAGDWTLVETQAPEGYDPAADQDITVEPGGTVNLTIENTETPPAAEVGTVTVNKVDEGGDPLAGACFALRQGAVNKATRCDNVDGANDGTITFSDIPIGDYTLRETKRPSLQYQAVADQSITVAANQTTTVEVENVLQPGRLVVRKVNQQGQVLQNACFRITPDPNNTGILCTGASGEVTFSSLPTGNVYKVTETKAPNGYQAAPAKTNISLTPGLTTKVTIVNKKKAPAPTDGSIRLIKFFCPAGKAGEITTVFDSSDPNAGVLSSTANCKKGNAAFTLELKNGQGDPITISTGTDGEYQTTLPAGTYIITEQSTGEEEELVVSVNQQTTIVVLNFVKPPAPSPATIKVVKYTCEAGFEGTYYADFIDNCGDPSSLTNGVVFRVSGKAVQKRTTGSTGQKGQTSFTQLPAGSYTLKEEPPSSAATVYAFCGYDQNEPDYKVLGTAINLTLGAGDVLTCTWFNVPDDLSDSTGAIVVHKYVCDIQGKVPANFDWFANCSIETDGVKFALSVKQGTKFVPSKTGITNEDGLLRFSRLKPGTYQLKEVGADWCYAESDNVDPQGNVLARAGQRSNVWIFNCVKTNQPPNTGAGTTAGLNSGAQAGFLADTPNSGALMFGLAWPLLGLVVFGMRRRPRALRRAA